MPEPSAIGPIHVHCMWFSFHTNHSRESHVVIRIQSVGWGGMSFTFHVNTLLVDFLSPDIVPIRAHKDYYIV